MDFGTTRFLRSGVRTAVFGVMLCALAHAQNTPAPQNSPSPPPPAAWDPDYGPPRTVAPPVSAQEPTDQQSGGQGGGASITPDKDDAGRFVFKKQVQEVVLHATVADDETRSRP